MIKEQPVKKAEDNTKPIKLENKTHKKKGRPKVRRETKKRTTLTILPSSYETASKIAYVDGKSVSEIFP